ncbi:FAD-dependent oxidoreductase [Streptomyces mirabilis]|uniref:FAD-dependent oxidoreductase n=1 Tax=Streptomyces mirabilis TaxID=68239 RepID=UPI0036696960
MRVRPGREGHCFGSAWTSLGTKVTFVGALEHLVPLEDESSSRLLERAFRQRGIDYHLSSSVAEVNQTPAGVSVRLKHGTSLSGEMLLVALGRTAVTEGPGLAEHGGETDDGGSSMSTARPRSPAASPWVI